MNIKYYAFPDDNFAGTYVAEEDYRHLSEYCDHLVEFSKLPCLPKDLENLREANAKFAQENFELKAQNNELAAHLNQKKLSANEEYLSLLENKITALESELQLAKISFEVILAFNKEDCNIWKNKYTIAQNKLDQIRNIL